MIEIPTWFATAVGSAFLLLLAVVGYLVKLIISENNKRLDSQDQEIGGLGKKLDAIQLSLTSIDRRFVEAELSATKQFVDKESHTRDFITLTAKVDAVHKRLDRVEHERG